MAQEKAKAPPALPPDAQAHVESLPAWLRDVAASAFVATADSAGVAKDQRERAETDRLTRHTQLVDQVVWVLRGGLGRHKEAAVAIESINRVLAGVQPRQSQVASLVLCESIIKEAKQRIRNSKAPAPPGRGAR